MLYGIYYILYIIYYIFYIIYYTYTYILYIILYIYIYIYYIVYYILYIVYIYIRHLRLFLSNKCLQHSMSESKTTSHCLSLLQRTSWPQSTSWVSRWSQHPQSTSYLTAIESFLSSDHLDPESCPECPAEVTNT